MGQWWACLPLVPPMCLGTQFQPGAIWVLSSLLVLCFLQGFFFGLQFSSFHKKKMSPNLNSTRIEEPHEKPDVASSLNVENFINTSCMEELLHCMQFTMWYKSRVSCNLMWTGCLLLSILRAESPSIFLDKSGRGRRLCEWLRDSLIYHSAEKMKKSGQLITHKNCWLFSHLTMVTALL